MEPKDYYVDPSIREYEERAEPKGYRVVTRKAEIDFRRSRQARSGMVVDKALGYPPTMTIRAFIGEIPPGSHTGRHRHLNDAIIHVLEGRGYTVVEETRYDWEAGDTIAIPVWAWHQHFNVDADRPVRYYAVTNGPLMRTMGVWRQEQGEYIPDR